MKVPHDDTRDVNHSPVASRCAEDQGDDQLFAARVSHHVQQYHRLVCIKHINNETSIEGCCQSSCTAAV